MMRLILSYLLVVTVLTTHAQEYKPVSWRYMTVQNKASEAELTFIATLDSGWHIYSQYISNDGPLPTTFTFNASEVYTRIGKVEELGTPVKSYDKTFMMDMIWFARSVTFVQKVKLYKPSATINGKIEFMVCTDEMCLPPDVVEFSINAKVDKPAKQKSIPEAEGKQVESVKEHPTTDSLRTSLNNKEEASGQQGDNLAVKPAKEIPDNSQKATTSLWSIFIAGLAGGFAALLMPCIFPMIPFTVSYFARSAKAVWHALLYGVSIIILYVGVGLLITVIFGSDALNALSTNGFFNFFIFALLIVFAASLLGAFEITLPSAWVNRVNERSERGGLPGVFFMAATLALVSFSCTAPIVGTLLVEATTVKNYLAPAVGMFGFALALALPFTVFALFPKWLNALPKSGSWLGTVKVTLGFLELALALKFLSNVDLAYHWQWFDREVFLVLWIIIFGLLGLYLLGKLRLSHESDTGPVSTARLFAGIVTLAFTLYMIPGLWGAPLKAVSAFLPPQHTQDFDLYDPSRYLTEASAKPDINIEGNSGEEGNFRAPLKLKAFFDYEQGLAYARQVNKPVILDFTGHACVNCRKMETTVWPDPEVLKLLKEEYVLIQLYVDDKTGLPEEQQIISAYSGKKLVTIGNKWSDFQASRYSANSQPWYVLLDTHEEKLQEPRGANYEIGEFKEFLTAGLRKFKGEIK